MLAGEPREARALGGSRGQQHGEGKEEAHTCYSTLAEGLNTQLPEPPASLTEEKTEAQKVEKLGCAHVTKPPLSTPQGAGGGGQAGGPGLSGRTPLTKILKKISLRFFVSSSVSQRDSSSVPSAPGRTILISIFPGQ